jgi:hypothetical protein
MLGSAGSSRFTGIGQSALRCSSPQTSGSLWMKRPRGLVMGAPNNVFVPYLLSFWHLCETSRQDILQVEFG